MPRYSRAKLAVQTWNALAQAFPDSSCSLDNDLPERLAIRGILSAQCTDKRVNLTSKELFSKYANMREIAEASADDIALIIKPCGLTASKTASVKDFADRLVNQWEGVIPNDADELMKVRGIGRKIANLIIGEVYGTPAIVVDTHCKRVMKRIGITDSDDPARVEKDMMKVFDEDKWIAIGHLSVDLGRQYCKAQSPDCGSCPASGFCRRKI